MPSLKIRDKTVLACVKYMKQMHEGQIRRNTNAPYWTHPLRVLELMEEAPFFFATRDKCAGLLHDVKGDSPLFSWDDIVAKFGHWVAGAVALLSKTKLGETRPDVYFAMLQHAHPSITAIKLFDRISNTEDFNVVSDAAWLEKYASDTVELVMPLVQVMVARGSIISPQGYYELGCWIEDRLQKNVHGMIARRRELLAGTDRLSGNPSPDEGRPADTTDGKERG